MPASSTTNRLVVDKALTLRSLNGPAVTMIQGQQAPGGGAGEGAVRCVYLTNGTLLSGFTLTNGAASDAGGGVYCESTNVVLTNCVLAGNSAPSGGGVWNGTLYGCTVLSNTAYYGGGSYSSLLSNCTLTGNSASRGGGAYASTLTNCWLTANSATLFGGGTYIHRLQGGLFDGAAYHCTYTANSSASGGGAFGGPLSDCTLISNSASNSGGGTYSCYLTNCTLTANAAGSGGGARIGSLTNCTLTANMALHGGGADSATLIDCAVAANGAVLGGGTYESTLNNCLLAGNSATNYGGGAYYGSLNNCTVVANSSSLYGGGISYSTLNNCILYYNTAPNGSNYFSRGTMNYCCTAPLPDSGAGNTNADPRLASLSHLSADSPCRGAGSPDYATGVDIDGEPWAHPPSIGCDELYSGSVTGAVSVAIQAPYTTVATNFTAAFVANITGRVSGSVWDFGDGTVVSNRACASYAWSAAGDYAVVLRAYSDTYSGGVSATTIVHVVSQPVSYVSLNSPGPVPPYNSWETAATNIQDAVDAAAAASVVLVSNGVYGVGGRVVSGAMTNRLAVTKPLTVQSVNGAAATIIRGYQVPGTILGDSAVRCVYLADGAVLAGFTLTNGATRYSGQPIPELAGGGVWGATASPVVSNCVIVGNAARAYGGGACKCTLINCLLMTNSANGGAGAFNGRLYNCILTGNLADYAAGADTSVLNNCTVTANAACGVGNCTLNNCIVYYNTAPNKPNYSGQPHFSYCCTTPDPGSGVGNVTNAPLFVDLAGSNLRLQTNSPCINAGYNGYVTNSTDFDGNPRIVGGTVDMGVYEYPSPSSTISYAWLQRYGLPTDGSADHTDADSDRMDNWQEWVAGTDPTNSASLLQLLPPAIVPPALLLRWNSDASHTYFIERASDLGTTEPFSLLQTNIAGLAGTTSFTDTSAQWGSAAFYRVGSGSGGASAPLWLEAPQLVPASVTVTWTSATNRSYVLESSTSLSSPMVFNPVATNVPGRAGTTSVTYTNASGPGLLFYRVGVQQ